MSKQVTVEELRENLEELIAEVESGETITIVPDHESREIVGLTMVQRGVRFPFRGFDPGPRPKNLTVDSVAMLIEERELERSNKKYGL
jgi:antitoxin (DNA-binding transcriptional repressor) of toxin-antitoxin stability system